MNFNNIVAEMNKAITESNQTSNCNSNNITTTTFNK